MGFYANKLFPWILDVSQPEEMAEQRLLALRTVEGSILEIGIGSGINIPYYPDNIKTLTTVDPSDGMRSRAMRRAGARGLAIEWLRGRGEKLPCKDGSFDSVVSTDVLCTVADVDAVLEEVYRVLKPGGRLHFLEHGLAREEKIRKWQIRLNGLNRTTACGCELTRDIEKHIRNSSFLIDEVVRVTPFKGMKALYTHIRGIAKKPA
jgi:ubiquinone/menaquinone biosynthesis C-methylase UbiE